MTLNNTNSVKKVALIGLGRWGTNILKTLGQIQGVALTHVVTSQTVDFGFKNINTLSHWRNLIDLDIDAVFIATPPFTHASIVEFFIENHIPCFVEKPLCLDYETALNLKNLALAEKVSIFVDHTQLFQPPFKEMMDFMDIDNVIKINLEGMGDGPIRKDVSVLWDWGSHDISIMLELLDSIPDSVSGYKTNSFIRYTFHYPNKLNVLITNSNVSTIKKRNITVYENTRIINFSEFPKNQLNIYQTRNITHNKLLDSVLSNAYTGYAQKPLYRSIQHFVDGISIKYSKDVFDLDKACNVIKLLEFADKAIESNKQMAIS